MAYEMEKEILQQPEVLQNLINQYITPENNISFKLPEGIKKLKFIASGSSYHCSGMVAKIFREFANIKASYEYASEFYIAKNIFIDQNTLYIFISQSGETFDTVEALKRVKAKGGQTLCITNCIDSSLWNLCDYKILSDAGEEKSIASTKALTAQLFCLYLLMLEFLKTKGHNITTEINEIKQLPNFIDKFLKNIEQIKVAADKLSKAQNAIIIGSKYYYSIAKEGALKIKETSYLDANAYPQGEFLHGHVAVLNNKPVLIAIVVEDTKESMELILSKIFEDYTPELITISNEDSINSKAMNIKIDTKNNIFNVFATVITFQVLAFETATKLGRNVDKPLGLKKIVK
ncbi:SIS domain-containing protein [bacterium]|nr:SIS domain-containing protein [bacterium]